MDSAARAEALLADMIEAQGLELLHVEFQPKGAGSILRIFIDKPGGVNLADCQRISKNASVLLDVDDDIPHKYTLEVSSPGIERPLFAAKDYRRYRGSEIQLVTIRKINERRKFRGTLLELENDLVSIECQDGIHSIPLEQVKKANLVYHF